ncbi:MAG: hypothetical protein FWG79_03560 [Bacteroidales bacterium]|nr:hypothetical protein [Bacteroidales bacterium]
MNINHHNYESILIDYLDGTLSEQECFEVDLFLQENPEIAEQFSDVENMILGSNEDIVFDKKDELSMIALPNSEFEQWEHTHPKLPQQLISYPHKQKLLKPEIRRIPQWTYYAAAACLAIAFWFFKPNFESESLEPTQIAVLPAIADEIEHEPLRTAQPSTPLMEHENLLIADRKTSEIQSTKYEEKLDNPTISNLEPDREFFAIATIIPISVSMSEDRSQLHSVPLDMATTPFVEEENLQISRREQIEIALNDRVVAPLKNTIHNVVRQFYVRKNDVEMFLDERDIPIFFAQR